MDVSSYLLAIQSLVGENPRDKYKELHSIATQIIKNDKEREEFISTGFTERVQPAILPHLRILIGNKLKLNNSVIEALKSDDIMVNKQALNAKWFYSSSNDIIRVDYFVSHVMPNISLRTRFDLVKALAHCLNKDTKKAEDFFESFADLCGVEQALPLITACSEDYIYNTILKRRIILRFRTLVVLYRKYPQLVIRYLQLGNEKNEANREDRKIHKVSLSNYQNFLPILIKRNAQEFIEFFEHLPEESKDFKLGNTRAEYFLRNSTDVLIKKPKIFLKLLPLKLVSNKLSTQQFEIMFENLFPKNVHEFSIWEIVKYLQYYPEEKKASLLISKYELLYSKDLLQDLSAFECTDFFKSLPADIREECGKRKYKFYLENTKNSSSHIEFLPPKESIELLKKMINIPSDIRRSHWLHQMIQSCNNYDSKDDLLVVLNYYKERHINEQACVLSEVLEGLINRFDVKSLNKEHWQVLKEIIEVSYVKGDLFTSKPYMYGDIFDGALHCLLKQSKSEPSAKDKELLDFFVKLKVEYYVEHVRPYYSLSVSPDIERDLLQRLLLAIPEKYPETFEVWNKPGIKLGITSFLIQSLNNFNVRHSYAESNNRYNTGIMDFRNKDIGRWKFTIRDYPWLNKFASDLLKMEDNDEDYKNFRKILRTHDLEFYQSLIDRYPNLINDIESLDALVVLKNDQNKILDKWQQYLKVCKEELESGNKFAKRFISAIRWYNEIPIKFLKQCLLEIKEKGSMLILGILLEGEALGQVVQPYLPNDNKINAECIGAKNMYNIIGSIAKAINFSNPPVSFDIIISLCQGNFVALASNTISCIVPRVPINIVLAYADQLIDKPISVKKIGIRMVFQVATSSELGEFLMRMWKNEKHPSIRELVGKKIFDVFRKAPTMETWKVVKACFDGITRHDGTVIKSFTILENIDMNFIAMYIKEIMNKIDEFYDDVSEKQYLISSISNSIDENIMHWLPEELITELVTRQFFYQASGKFLFKVYLLSNENMFEQRLEIIMKNLRQEALKLDQPLILETKQSRHYPANSNINTFFKSMFNQLVKKENCEMATCVLNSALELFSTIIRPYQLVATFISLCMYKNYYEAKIPKEFGVRFGKNIKDLVNEFGSEFFLFEISSILNQFLHQKFVYKDIKVTDSILLVTMGLMESDKYYGSLVGIKLVEQYQRDMFNESYDELMKIWSEIENVAVKTLVQHCLKK